MDERKIITNVAMESCTAASSAGREAPCSGDKSGPARAIELTRAHGNSLALDPRGAARAPLAHRVTIEPIDAFGAHEQQAARPPHAPSAVERRAAHRTPRMPRTPGMLQYSCLVIPSPVACAGPQAGPRPELHSSGHHLAQASLRAPPARGRGAVERAKVVYYTCQFLLLL